MHFPREWAQFWAQYRKYDFRKIWRVVAKHRYPRALDGERGRNRTYNLLIKSHSTSSQDQLDTGLRSENSGKDLQNPQPPRNKKEGDL